MGFFEPRVQVTGRWMLARKWEITAEGMTAPDDGYILSHTPPVVPDKSEGRDPGSRKL